MRPNDMPGYEEPESNGKKMFDNLDQPWNLSDEYDACMTIREYAYIKFAAAVLQGIYASGLEQGYHADAQSADKQARAMLAKMQDAE